LRKRKGVPVYSAVEPGRIIQRVGPAERERMIAGGQARRSGNGIQLIGKQSPKFRHSPASISCREMRAAVGEFGDTPAAAAARGKFNSWKDVGGVEIKPEPNGSDNGFNFF
jgi:hypothetical protein